METKLCCTCKQERPVDLFSKNKSSKDGLKPYCKECASKKSAAYREKYRVEVNKRKRASYMRSKERADERTQRQIEESPSRVCSFCGKEKPIEDFYKCGNGGFRSYCKACANKESRISYMRKHDANISRKRAYNKAHKAEIDEYNHKYYAEHSDEVIARVKKWESENPERASDLRRLSSHRIRAIKAGTKAQLTMQEWKECKEFFSVDGIVRCAYCGKPMQKLTQDHVIPISSKGEHVKNNIVPACKSCNSSKSNKVFIDWYRNQPFYSKDRERKIQQYLAI